MTPGETGLKLLSLPGDGIGPEIMRAALAVLDAVRPVLSRDVVVSEADIGFRALEAEGTTIPDAVISAARAVDGVLLGPVSHNEYPPREQGGLTPSGGLRKELDEAGYADTPERAALIDDIVSLAKRYGDIMQIDAVSVRLAVVTTNSCRKFHADYVKARLITTYVGTGTLWIEAEDAARVVDAQTQNRGVAHPTDFPIQRCRRSERFIDLDRLQCAQQQIPVDWIVHEAGQWKIEFDATGRAV